MISMDLTARSSVAKPMPVLMASTSRIAIASVHSRNSAAMAAAAARSQTTGPFSWLIRILRGGCWGMDEELVRPIALQTAPGLLGRKTISLLDLQLTQHG